MIKKLTYFILAALIIITPAFPCFGEEKLSLIDIKPSGEDVPAGRQITFHFTGQVVPLGRMERKGEEVPISFSPKLDCAWRWLSPSTLSCELTEKGSLRVATKYDISISENALTPEAETVRKILDSAFDERSALSSFSTERPQITSGYLRTWVSPGRPLYVLQTNQNVKKSSLEQHAFFQSESTKIGIKLVPDPEEGEEGQVPQAGAYWFGVPDEEFGLGEPADLMVEPGLESTEGTLAGNENRIIDDFVAFDEFEFVGVKCCTGGANVADGYCNEDDTAIIEPGDSDASNKRCYPLAPISLVFSSPVLKDDLAPGLNINPPIREKDDTTDPWEGMYSYVNTEYLEKDNEAFPVSLPFGLKAYKKYKVSGSPEKIIDVFGRKLSSPFSVDFYTDHRLPRLVSDKLFSFLERDVNSHLPIVVQNLNSLTFRYSVLSSAGVSGPYTKEIPVDNVQDVSYHFPLKIRELLTSGRGVLQGTLTSKPETKSYFVSSQVTPFYVHVKLGHFGTLVWVADLRTGEPVEDASVSVVKERADAITNAQALSTSKTDKDGVATLPGSSSLDPYIGTSYYGIENDALKVKVQKGDDLALVPLVSAVMVDAEGAGGKWMQIDRAPSYGHIRAWGTTPQGVYRLGDKVHYKIYVRNEGTAAMALPPKGGYSLSVFDPTDRSVYERKNVTLSDFGSIEGDFQAPQGGKVGWYRFELKASFPGDENISSSERFSSTWGKKWFEDRYRTWEPLKVLVTDFTPSPFRVQTELVGKNFLLGDAVSLNVRASLHSGGPYGSAESRVVARLTPGTFPALPNTLTNYSFSDSDYSGDYESEIFRNDFTLTSQGELSTSFTIPESSVRIGNLVVEGAVADERGKYVASSVSAPFAARDRFAGVNFSKWIYEVGKLSSVDVVVVNQDGIPAPGTSVEVKIIHKETFATRVKGPGNAYLPRYETKESEVKACTLVSADKPVNCSFTPQKPGEYFVKASIKDSKDREHNAATSTYVVGKGELIWASDSPTRLDVVPEKTTYKVGEKAKFLVKNPYPGAKALITVERYGIVSKWFETMKGAAHMISFDIEKNHLPGFYLSVVAFSPRVEMPIEGEIDLGKPAMKLGYAEIEVKDSAKELKVTAVSDKQKYSPKETVKVKLHAETREGAAVPTEFAVAVLDEAIFDLILNGDRYFDPYTGLYKLDSLDVSNFNLLLQLVGRRKFQKKGANSGGDGGLDTSSRSNIKYVSYWNPSLMANSSGNASFEFEAPDNLTGWRVLAIAMTKSDRMGLGVGHFKVNRNTEIRPAIPNKVREGDSFDARFSIMNRTDSARTLSVKLEASGEGFDKKIVEEKIVAEPFERKFISIPLVAAKEGDITLTASAEDNIDKDSLIVKLPVFKTKNLEFVSFYGSLAEDKVEAPVKLPKLLDPSDGGIRLSLSPSIISSAEPHVVALRDYPFSCWEQRISRTVGAAHAIALASYLPASAAWTDAKAVVESGLNSARDFQSPSGGMTYYIPTDDRADPYLSAYTALGFEWLKGLGYSVPKDVESNLHGYLDRVLRHGGGSKGYSEEMLSTVRALTLNALSRSGKIKLEDLKRLDPTLPRLSIFGRANLAEASLHVEGGSQYRAELLRLLLNQSNETPSKFSFQEPISFDGFERILSSELRSTCSVLAALVGGTEQKETAEKVARTILREAKRNSTTQENVFCLTALAKYAGEFEKEEPKGTWSGFLFGEKLSDASFSSRRDQPITAERRFKASDPGREGNFELTRSGIGRAYFTFGFSYFDPSEKKAGKNAGVELRRVFSVLKDKSWIPMGGSFEIKRGDTVRVVLTASLPGPRHFLVVDDPVPGGLEPVNRDLATASNVDSDGADDSSSHVFYHRELKFDSARFYSEYADPGNYTLSYIAQAIATGTFSLPEAKALEMYEPEVYGTSNSGLLAIKE